TIALTVAGIFVNMFIMLPLYMPTADFATKLNLAIYTIAPFNFVRGTVLSLITIFIYKRISGILK
ncbi:MAG: ECF transporter S component, partial [Clostridia bacterium]|nr:ECF transporter S component [Clostridia bacterium]